MCQIYVYSNHIVNHLYPTLKCRLFFFFRCEIQQLLIIGQVKNSDNQFFLNELTFSLDLLCLHSCISVIKNVMLHFFLSKQQPLPVNILVSKTSTCTFMNFLCERGHYVIRKMLAIKKSYREPGDQVTKSKELKFRLKICHRSNFFRK